MEEKEYCFTGYCRQIDQSRMVMVEVYDGRVEADCCFDGCPYTPNCTVAKQVEELKA